ncbi:MAG: tetratricopeptide repeat protein [Lachnospiraceae bacterium]|nr:tetratricopeptide repeat protein [Lachnospiraceae bacterium]
MKCFHCGFELSDKEFCTSCGADVKLYKKIMHISNRFYNEGLNKANVRDLSGAVISLRQALKFNKNHVEARNLLGLVYFEMGEPVAALSEWVISKNIRPQKNIADDYINDVQSNPSRLETINQTVKKYNQALAYCYADSSDLAIIQLKKVVSLNPRFVKAQLLLALLYINDEEWEKAEKALKRCLKVDVNNTTALRYLKEVNLMLEGDETATPKKKKSAVAKEAITYQSGNETIIQPISLKEPVVGSSTVLNVLIGLVIGLAVCYFLIVPAKVQSAQAEIEDQLQVISENSDEKTAQITDLEQRVSALTDENTKLTEQLQAVTGEGGAIQSVDGLLATANSYISDPDDLDILADSLYQIDKIYVETESSEAYRNLYHSILEQVGGEIADNCFSKGKTLKNQGDYSAAIEILEKAWYFDNESAEILYTLAETYQESGNMDKANELYSKLITDFSDSEYAQMAQQNIADAATGGNRSTNPEDQPEE